MLAKKGCCLMTVMLRRRFVGYVVVTDLTRSFVNKSLAGSLR